MDVESTDIHILAGSTVTYTIYKGQGDMTKFIFDFDDDTEDMEVIRDPYDPLSPETIVVSTYRLLRH